VIDLNGDQDWVVTYTIEFGAYETLITEFYRGPQSECLRIKAQSGCGEHDLRKTRRWHPIAGPAEEWDGFLEG
jgi:hypothetical protein